MGRMKILFFAGSTRQQSFNRRLARCAAQMAQDCGAEATLLELGGLDIPLYNADLEARGTPPDVLRLKELLWQHPAWVVCSPEYNGSYPALLKNTLDWASSPVASHPEWGDDGVKPFRNKVVGVLSASSGRLGGLRAQAHLAPLLTMLGCWLAPRSYALANAASAFDAQGALATPEDRAGVHAVVAQVLWAAARLQDSDRV